VLKLEQSLEAISAGVTVAVALPDGTIRNYASGYADLEQKVAMTSCARMPSGSIGKSYVAAVVLSMVAEGALQLDAPIAPWFANVAWYCRLPNYQTITLRQLLNHSSGIIDHVFDTGLALLKFIKRKLRSEQRFKPFKPLDLIQFALDREPLFAPGQGFHYSDTGYLLIGMIIEQASSLSYYEQLSKRILTPLLLSDTLAFNRRDIPGLVPGYAAKSQRLFGIPEQVIANGQLIFHPSLEWTGGGLVSTSSDLVRWAKALFEHKAIPAIAVTDILTSVAKLEQSPDQLDRVYGYGLGINIVPSRFGTCYRHNGFFPGYHSILGYYPDSQVAIAMQINTDAVDIDPYFAVISAHIFNALAMP
jgi:D-alanyl-D-alanine carboxypeptidase